MSRVAYPVLVDMRLVEVIERIDRVASNLLDRLGEGDDANHINVAARLVVAAYEAEKRSASAGGEGG